MEVRSHRLHLGAQDSPIADVRRAVDRLAVQAGLSADARFDLQVAVSEAVANALRHGHGERVDVAFATHDGLLEVEVSDGGRFAPRAGLDHEGGRGLPLMVALLDEVEFSAGDAGTCVRLRKRLPASS